MSELQKLKKDLRDKKKLHKQALKNLKNYYKEDLKSLKQRHRDEIAEIKVAIRATRKAIRQEKRDGRPSLLDETTLALCKPFEKKAEDIRYKQSDPEGWEADQVVDEINEMVKYYKKRMEKGKELKDRDLEALVKLQAATTPIIENQRGKLWAHAQFLSDELGELILGHPVTAEAAKGMMEQAEKMMDTLLKVPEKQVN